MKNIIIGIKLDNKWYYAYNGWWYDKIHTIKSKSLSRKRKVELKRLFK